MPPGVVKDGTVILDGSELHHCVRVCRVRTGDVVKLLDGRGNTYEARVARISAGEALLEVLSRETAPPLPPVDLALGMIKAPRFDIAVEKCTELGIRRLIPFISARCVRRGDRVTSGPAIERIRRKIIASCKQSGCPYFPEIDAPQTLDALEKRFSFYEAVYLAEQSSEAPVTGVADPSAGPVLGIVGPEGGLTPEERSELVARGAVPLSLGTFRLRSETAAICLSFRLLGGASCSYGKGAF